MIQKAARRESFEQEVVAHLDQLWQTALWLTRNENDATKLIQDLYFIAYRLWEQWNYFGDTRIWMFKVLVRLYTNRYHRDTQTSIANSNGYISETIIGDDALAGIFAELPEEIRLTLVLSLVGKFSYNEIADIAGVRTSMVRHNIYYGYIMLEKQIAKFVSADY